MANFNIDYTSGVLTYKDAKGNTIPIATSTTNAAIMALIAPEYTKTTYAAKSLVTHGGKLYTNAAQISTAENWTAAHWTETTVAAWAATL